jgi:hypothetical protein
MGNVYPRQRIGTDHIDLLTGSERQQSLAGFQCWQGAFQTFEVETMDWFRVFAHAGPVTF